MEGLSALKEMMEGLLKPLQEKVEGIAAENARLKEQLRQNMDLTTDTGGLPGHLRPAGSTISYGDLRIARSVVVATNPVIDSPDDPMWSGSKICSPDLLVRNSLSGGMKE